MNICIYSKFFTAHLQSNMLYFYLHRRSSLSARRLQSYCVLRAGLFTYMFGFPKLRYNLHTPRKEILEAYLSLSSFWPRHSSRSIRTQQKKPRNTSVQRMPPTTYKTLAILVIKLELTDDLSFISRPHGYRTYRN